MPHTTTIRVRWHELDPYGHVNHAAYLNYFESARVELLDDIGWGLPRMASEGLSIVVADLTVHFHAPAVASDVLTVTTWVAKLNAASSRWHQEMTRDSQPIATFDARAAMLTTRGRPTRAPDDLVAALKAYVITDAGSSSGAVPPSPRR